MRVFAADPVDLHEGVELQRVTVNGREFPMMNSQGVLEKFAYHVFVATHELAHSYFPLLVGVNERNTPGWTKDGPCYCL